MEKEAVFDNQTIHDYRIEMLDRITKVIEEYDTDEMLLVNQLRRVFYTYIDYLEDTILMDSKKKIDTTPYVSNINRQLGNFFTRDTDKSLISLVFNLLVDTNSMIIEMMSQVTDIDLKLYFYGQSYRELRELGYTNDEITKKLMTESPYDSEVMLYVNHTNELHKKFIKESLLVDIYLVGVMNDYVWEKGFKLDKVFLQIRDMLSSNEVHFYKVFYKRLEKNEKL